MNDTRGFWARAEIWIRNPAHAALSAVWLFLIAASLSVPVDRKGDGSEYILATESLYYDGDLIVDNKVDIFRHLMKRPQNMDTPAGLTRIRGTDGMERYGLHSFYYPVLALPFYAAFGYTGFPILNALLVGTLITAVYSHASRRHSSAAALAFSAGSVFFSAAWAYVFWTQADTLYPALLAVFFHEWFAGRPVRAAAAVGAAIAAQPALGVFAVPLLVELVRRRSFRTAVLSALAIAAWAAPQLAYNVFWLGAALPMSRMGLASIGNASPSLFLRWLIDPSVGLVWFYPAVVFCLLAMRATFRSLSLLACAFAALGAMTFVHTFYSHQVGGRYANWVFPAFLFLADDLGFGRWPARLAAAFTIAAGAGLAVNPVGNSRDMDLRHKTLLPYRLASLLSLPENPEVFAYSSEELAARRVYARPITRDGWTAGNDRTELLLAGVVPGELALDVRPWANLEEHQRVALVTASGARREFLLPPGETGRIEISLRAEDIQPYSRWKQGYAYVSLWAQGWSPAIAQQGDRPEAHDLRRLGVLVERVTLGDKVLFERLRQRGP